MQQSQAQLDVAPDSLTARSGLAFVSIVTLVGAVVRLLYLGHKSLWLDEAVSVSIAQLDWTAFRDTLWQREGNMALYYLLLRPFVAWGTSEWWVRLPSAIAGIATVPVMFVLGAKLFGRRVGGVASLLFAANACSVVYSQEARGYSLAVLLVAASMLLFAKLVESPSWAGTIAYALVAALAIYAHFFAALVVVGQWLSLFFLPAGKGLDNNKLATAMALTALLSLPAAEFILTKNVGQLSWVPKPSLLEVYHLGLFLSAEGGKVIGNILLVLFVLALGVGGREAVRTWRSSGASGEGWNYALVCLCFLIPIVLTLAISLRTPVFFHRFLIICLPSFILFIAVGLSKIDKCTWALAIISATSIIACALSYSRTREQWREAEAFVAAQARPRDQIVFFESWGRVPFNYYAERAPVANKLHEMQPETLVGGNERTWAVIYPLPTIDGATREMEVRWDAHFPNHEVRDFRGLRITLYDPNVR